MGLSSGPPSENATDNDFPYFVLVWFFGLMMYMQYLEMREKGEIPPCPQIFKKIKKKKNPPTKFKTLEEPLLLPQKE